MYRIFFKGVIDFGLALLLILIVSPVLFIAILCLLISNNGKVFFVQKRPGKNGKPFFLIKFKTMNDKGDKNGLLLPDSQRITRLGRIIRNSSIDELPQLFNILLGDMSLVGPRPLLMRYLPLYDDFQNRRHEVKPGITGWAQVNGRNSISWDQKFEYDVWYVDNLSFVLDVKIILRTFLKVIKRESINNSSSTTMEPFRGS